VYLQQRTARDLVNRISAKISFDPTSIVRTLHVNSKGLNIMIDDDWVTELPEGQDMKIELTEIIKEPTSLKHEFDSGLGNDSHSPMPPMTEAQITANVDASKRISYEMKLRF
jgi:hypothetical protein